MRQERVHAVRRVVAVVLGVWALGAASPSLADDLADAHQAYLKGDYRRAAGLYETTAAERGLDADLAFDLGNAHFQQGHFGPAVYYYEIALMLRPGHPGAAANWAETQKRLHEKGEASAALFTPETGPAALVERLPVTVISAVFVVVYVLVFAGLGLRRFVRGPRAARAVLVALGGLVPVAVVTGAVTLASAYVQTYRPKAIVLAAARLAEGPDDNFKAVLDLPEGIAVRITAQERGFAHVRLANGLEGWVRVDALGIVPHARRRVGPGA